MDLYLRLVDTLFSLRYYLQRLGMIPFGAKGLVFTRLHDENAHGFIHSSILFPWLIDSENTLL
jgi:hypothetical protein